MTPAPAPPLAELTPVAQFQTSSSVVATIVFFQQLTAQVCFITFSIAQPQFRAGLQLDDRRVEVLWMLSLGSNTAKKTKVSATVSG
jgi:hypothetical protein